MNEDILRLLVVREPASKENEWRLEPFPEGTDQTELAGQVRTLTRQRAQRRDFIALGQGFRTGARYVRDVEDLSLNLDRLPLWVQQHSLQRVVELNLGGLAAQLGEGHVSTTGENPLADVVNSSQFSETYNRLHDSILADSLDSRVRTETTDKHLAAFKMLMLLRRSASNQLNVAAHVTLSEWLARTVLVLNRIHRAHPEFPAEPARPAPPDSPNPKLRVEALQKARHALLRTVADPLAVSVARAPRRVPGETFRPDPEQITRAIPDSPRVRETVRPDRASLILPSSSEAFRISRERPEAEQQRPRLSREAVNRLGNDTAETLRSIGLNADELDPFRALPLLDQELAAAARELPAPAAKRVLVVSGGMIDLDKARTSLGQVPPKYKLSAVGGCQLNAGVGDLLIVRQNLKAYELADFAHVENVLAGEFREREHRRLDLTEETRTEEQETTTDKERDLQSTERNEMQSEMERTVQSQFGIEAGLQVSGSYGPTVSFSSSLNVSYSTNTEETQRKAASFSREITERTADRVRERTRKELRRRTLHQIEELNRHRVDNSTAANGHVRGIYRWLNKVYDAQVFNYGKRMMLEFVIPEPAAYFMYAVVQNPPKSQELKKPEPPTVGMRPLHPGALDLDTAQGLIAQYEVLDAPPYPPSSIVVSHFDGMEGTGSPKSLGRGSKVPIPAGYTTNTARLSGGSAGMGMDMFMVLVGGVNYCPLYDGMTDWVTLKNTYSNEISISVYCGYQEMYVLGIDLFCTLSEDGMRKWQQQTYDAIMRTYQSQLADYEEKLAALEIQKGIQIFGRNPLENRRLERDELKKLAVIVLTDDIDPSLDGFSSSPEPALDVDAACEAGQRIRFFENAFEWSNMTYVLYPYFWGRKARWEAALQLTDPDPDFAAFLKAGAARVQVPVRPGFEKAIAYYLQTGVIWNGNDPPLIGDELYVPIVEEITEALGRPEPVVPYPEGSEPWEVRVPTSLVLVQNLEEIPGIIDTLTGNPVAINPGG